jgi:hypothetical protein
LWLLCKLRIHHQRPRRLEVGDDQRWALGRWLEEGLAQDSPPCRGGEAARGGRRVEVGLEVGDRRWPAVGLAAGRATCRW